MSIQVVLFSTAHFVYELEYEYGRLKFRAVKSIGNEMGELCWKSGIDYGRMKFRAVKGIGNEMGSLTFKTMTYPYSSVLVIPNHSQAAESRGLEDLGTAVREAASYESSSLRL